VAAPHTTPGTPFSQWVLPSAQRQLSHTPSMHGADGEQAPPSFRPQPFFPHESPPAQWATQLPFSHVLLQGPEQVLCRVFSQFFPEQSRVPGSQVF
jgi:hypothetical protein